MGSVTSVNPANGSLVDPGQSFTISLLTDTAIKNCDLTVNNSYVGKIVDDYVINSPYAMQGGTNEILVFIPDQYVNGIVNVSFMITYSGETAQIQYNYTYHTVSKPSAPVFTDDPIVRNETPVKAVHISEMQSFINSLRAYHGLGNYSFTPVSSGDFVNNWTTVIELRAAVSPMASGVSWVSLPNHPSKDVIDQLRNLLKTL